MSTEAVELAIRMTADADEAVKAADRVGSSYGEMASDVDRATAKADQASSRMDTMADSSDEMASKSAQAAGGIGDLAGALEATGLISEGTAASMELGSQAIMGVTGASDLMNLAMSSTVVTTAKAKAASIAHAVATKAQAAATKAMAIAQRILNVAMRANPIGLIITAILAVVGGLILAYKRSETFRKIVDKVMDAVRGYIQAVLKVLGVVVGFFRDKLPDAAAWVKDRVVAGFQVIRDRVSAIFAGIRETASNVWGRMVDGVRAAKDRIVAVADAIRDKFSTIFGRIRDLIQPVIDIVADLIDRIRDIHLPDLPFVGRTATASGRMLTSSTGTRSAPTVINNWNITGILDSGDAVATIEALFVREGRALGYAV